ncbi:MotB family protein [Mesorhizobium sp. L-8-3]|uniref:MotB family protein n=1 Tax=Mesorhizobium sp. L-8-3 TaxID=2744522 RepID=UPI001928317C|nr:MotB family protein [Mesorhizobium sp. L-8-3]BCH23145.1 flagellar motor protein MotB [Mesorhizobium sp. L-8-3]
MSAVGDDRREIIIVRRSSDDADEGHHGGVWKIAFADFMTAMMCFFLVMWLINAANEETKLAVASYFNPIKLVDRSSSPRGLDNLSDDQPASENKSKPAEADAKQDSAEGAAKAGPSPEDNSALSADDKNFSDENLFRDPYAVLAEIASDTGAQQNISARGDGGAADSGPATGASGGDAYRDPFAPDFWSQEMAAPPPAETAMTKADSTELAEASTGQQPAATPAETGMSELQQAFPTAPEEEPEEVAAQIEEPVDQAGQADKASPDEDSPDAAVEQTAARIGQELHEAFKDGDKMYGGITVVPTDKGVMISVTDQLNVGMFEIGSAVPRRELVLAMEKISKALMAEKGNIVINGHTDSRPFASKTYDNWRLSTARAHSAYYMLARAGLDERRIVEVAGYADRKLKVKDDPNAEANRRIEILLETGN